MPDAANALCAAPEGFCGLLQFPTNCLGQVVDLVTGDPVTWDDYAPAGALSAVGTLTHTETILLDPVLQDDVTVAEGRPGEYTVPGYTRHYQGVRTLDRTVNVPAETVMGLMDAHTDSVSDLVLSSTPVTGASRCSVCGPTGCMPTWVEIVISPLYDISEGSITPATRGGSALYQWQIHPKLRAIGGVNVAKTKRGQDAPDRNVTVRAEANPPFWAQIKANPPDWFPSGSVKDMRTGATVNPLTSNLYEASPLADFYAPIDTAALPEFMIDGSCTVCGWLNPPAA